MSERSHAERSRVTLPARSRSRTKSSSTASLSGPGDDFQVDGRTLVFDRSLASEGRLGFWRWLSLFLGVAGTYRQNDSVDAVYSSGGRRVVASGLAIDRGQTP